MAMIRKKVDARIKSLIDNGIIQNHRSFFVIIGDKAKDQVINIHQMLSKASVGTRPSVLWCYKKDLGFSTHKQKRLKIIKRKQRQGTLDPDQDDPFELFMTSTNVRWTYYKDSHKVLGTTFGMCVLQDFEAITPNILARTIETVSGGGIVCLLLKTMASLKQLYSIAMDSHAKYRTESYQDVVPRFNERFLLSLVNCKTSLIMDDELNILPISLASRQIVPLPPKASEFETPEEIELNDLKEALKDTKCIGPLIKKAKTLDQGKALVNFFEAISERTLRSTVALTAARGRGKSAALGLAIAGAVAFGYSNIFVTSPSPENLQTLFQFIFLGFDQLEYKEHQDYEIVQSTNPEFHNCIVRVNIYRSHRQVIQYITPTDSSKLGQAELLVIDEAAAIPLPFVRALMGPYLCFISSTVNGYEGTGRSLSLKLIKELRDKAGVKDTTTSLGRTFREIELKDPIRYNSGDQVETWLNQLLCLDCTEAAKLTTVPHPSKCELFYINRDTLFSYHKVSEIFLQRLMSLYVSSHYKNSPNDLMLMSDAPAHQLFVLLPPTDTETKQLPDPLVVIQVSLEGAISKESILTQKNRSGRPPGDLIPWSISQQFQDDDFPSLSGARVVRIATHPQLQGKGYGSHALKLLTSYYEGKLTDLDIKMEDQPTTPRSQAIDGDLNQIITPRRGVPPLFLKVSERPPEKLHYFGVSFGMTAELFNFWKKASFFPVYLRLTELAVTGEHTCIMLKNLEPVYHQEQIYNSNWLAQFYEDFTIRFSSLLGFVFRKYSVKTAFSLLSKQRMKTDSLDGGQKEYFGRRAAKPLTKDRLDTIFSPYDLKRLESYASNIIDYHVVIDTIPSLARLVFIEGHSDMLGFSPAQACLLIGMGLQYKSIEECAKELQLQQNQVMALFHKTIRKFTKVFREVEEADEGTKFPQAAGSLKSKIDKMTPTPMTLEEELEEEGEDAARKLKERQNNLLASLVNPDFAIQGDNEVWTETTKNLHDKVPNIVSIKRKRVEATVVEDQSHKKQKMDKKKEQQQQKKQKRKSDRGSKRKSS